MHMYIYYIKNRIENTFNYNIFTEFQEVKKFTAVHDDTQT